MNNNQFQFAQPAVFTEINEMVRSFASSFVAYKLLHSQVHDMPFKLLLLNRTNMW